MPADGEREPPRLPRIDQDDKDAWISTNSRTMTAKPPLDANWQSALCVTSVYDAMAQLQKENESLREELQVAKKTHEIFAARAIEVEQARAPERVNVCDKHEQEIRLLRREKLQLERLGEQQRVALEKRLREAETACQQQISKYQEKYALDPNASKRVAISVQTLRDTLEKVVEEKEELSIRFAQLNQLHAKMQQEHSKTVAMLEGNIVRIKAQRGVQRVIGVLERWSASNVERVWRIWTTQTRVDRVQTAERSAALKAKIQLQGYVSRLVSSRLGEMVTRSALAKMRVSFEQWRRYSHIRRRCRQIIALASSSRSQLTTKRVMESWRQFSRNANSRRAGIGVLLSVMRRHSCRRALKLWFYRTHVEFPSYESIRESLEMQDKIAELTEALSATRQELELSRQENQQMLASISHERRNADEVTKQKLETELAIKERIGRFLRKQSNRQLLLGVMTRWRGTAALLRSLKKRVVSVQAKLLQRRLRKSVQLWCHYINDRRKFAIVVNRLRNLTVMRCFNSWKQGASEASALKSALRHAVFKMQHQQIARCFARWRDVHDRRRQVKSLLTSIAIWIEKRWLAQALSTWQSHLRLLMVQKFQQDIEERRRQLDIDYGKQKIRLIVLLKCFYCWRQHVRGKSERVRLLEKYARRLKNITLLRTIRSWTYFCDRRKHTREIVRRWLFRSYTGRLAMVLRQWKQYAISQSYSTTAEEAYQQYERRVDRLKHQLSCYGMMQEDLHQQFSRERMHHEQSLRGLALRLAAAKSREGQLCGVICTLCTRSARANTLRKVLMRWHWVTRDARTKSQIVRVFQIKMTARKYQALFTTWKKRWMDRKRIITSVTKFKRVYHCHLLAVMWNCWIEFRCHQKRIKDFARLCFDRANTCCLVDVVREWRKVSRTNYLLRTAVARVLHRSASGQLRDSFLTWLKWVRALAIEEKEVKRKKVLEDMRVLISIKWSLSVAQTVFEAWKAFASRKRAHHKGAQRLKSAYHQLLLQQCLSAWQTSLDKQVALSNWLRRWMAKTVTRKQERAFRVWKSAVLRTQMEDVQTLRSLYEQERIVADKFKEKASILQVQSDAVSEKLEEITNAHTLAVKELERTSQLVCLSRWMGAWKAYFREKQHLSRALSSLTRRRQKQCVAFHLGSWWKFVQCWRQVHREVERRRQQLRLRIQRLCFQSWYSKFEVARVLKRRTVAFLAKSSRRCKLHIMASWRSYVNEAHDVRAGSERMQRVLCTLATRMAFLRWTDTFRRQQQRDRVVVERQVRLTHIVQYFQKRCYTRAMSVWRRLVSERRSQLQRVNRSFRSKCLETKRAMFDQWEAYLLLLSRQRKQLDHAVLIGERAVYRWSLRAWTKNAHRLLVGSLSKEISKLAQQQERTDQELHATAIDLEKLKTTLHDTRSVLSETESRLDHARAQSMNREARTAQAVARIAVIQKIVLRRFVAQNVARSFRLWRERCAAMEKRKKAIHLFTTMLHRQLRLHAFSQWKEEDTRLKNQMRFVNAVKTRTLRRYIQQWRRYTTRKAAIELFLTRRLLIYVARPPRLAWGFRQWRLAAEAMRATNLVKLLTQDVKHRHEHSTDVSRRFYLAKWLWAAYSHRARQMRSFIMRCQSIVAAAKKTDHETAIRLLEANHSQEAAVQQKRAAEELKQSALRAQEEACDCEELVTGPSMGAIKALLHRISQATVVHELFVSVSGTLSQFLHGCSAILFLFDPSSNELWTQREPDRIIQVPVSIGITGCTLSSGSMVQVESMLEDPRFHPMVDQLVLGDLRASDAQSALLATLGASAARARQSAGRTVALLSSPLLSNDGVVYGVLQVAVPTSSLSAKQLRKSKLQSQLLARACASIVEQLLADLLRNCRDRVRSRTPDRFAKLFKQSKNWRKYYAALERKSAAIHDQLRAVSEERDALVERSSGAQADVLTLKRKLETYQTTEREFAKQVAHWKKKLFKLKALLDDKEALVQQKASELRVLTDDFQRYRKHQRSRELDAALARAPGSRFDKHKYQDATKEADFSDAGQLAILRADCTAVKNQLVRAESDNLLLVRALEMARQNDGQLPAAIAQEVSRISTRVGKSS